MGQGPRVPAGSGQRWLVECQVAAQILPPEAPRR